MNVYVLAQALRATWGEEAAIVVTNLDHEANGGAWRRLEANGVEVREWKLDVETAELRAETLTPLLEDGKVKLVCFTHCSNVVGTIHDVAALTEICHAAGAQVCVDGVAYAPHRKVDVKALNVDWYLISLYKVYGPHVGLLYGKREAFLAARNQNHFFYSEEQIPNKLMPGTVSHELAAGITGALAYLDHGRPPARGRLRLLRRPRSRDRRAPSPLPRGSTGRPGAGTDRPGSCPSGAHRGLRRRQPPQLGGPRSPRRGPGRGTMGRLLRGPSHRRAGLPGARRCGAGQASFTTTPPAKSPGS